MGKILFLRAPVSLKEIYGELAEAGNQSAPLGLAQLAAITRNAGHETRILDSAAYNLGYTETVDQVMKFDPDYVGLTSTTLEIENTGKLARMIKERNPKIKIIIGGPHFTALPEDTFRRYPYFDVGVYREGDITITELLEALDKNKPLNNIKGIYYLKSGKLIFTGERSMIHDLDSLPMPAYDLLPDITKFYLPPGNSVYRTPVISMVSSRGCPLTCTFCANIIFQNRCRAYSAEYVMKIIRHLYNEYGIREIQFYDDNFTAYRPRLIELCNMLIKEKLDLSWFCEASVNLVNEDILKLMKKAGCWQIAYGCESANQEILDFYKKRVTVQQIESTVRMTRKAGIKVKGFFMMGNPLETKQTLKKTIDFILKVPFDDVHITYFTPMPGSAIYDVADQYGKFDNDWKKFTIFYPLFIPNGLRREDIEKAYKEAYRRFYFRPKIVLYVMNKLRQPALRKKIITGGFSLIRFLIKGNKARKNTTPK